MQMWIKAASEHFGRSDIRPFSEKLAPDLQQKWLGGCRRASVQSMRDKTRRSSIRQRSKLNEAHASFGRHAGGVTHNVTPLCPPHGLVSFQYTLLFPDLRQLNRPPS